MKIARLIAGCLQQTCMPLVFACQGFIYRGDGGGGGGGGGEAPPPPKFFCDNEFKKYIDFLPCDKHCALLGILLWSALRIIRNTTMVSMEFTTSSNLWM